MKKQELKADRATWKEKKERTKAKMVAAEKEGKGEGSMNVTRPPRPPASERLWVRRPDRGLLSLKAKSQRKEKREKERGSIG